MLQTAEPSLELQEMFAPVSFDTFTSEYWTKTPLLIERVSTAFETLVPPGDVDEIVDRACSNADEFDLFPSGGDGVDRSLWVGPGNYVYLNRLLGLYQRGGTIRISNVQKYHRGIRRFCLAMSEGFRCEVEADLWMTRANEASPHIHYDGTDIYVHQISGCKRWRAFNRAKSDYAEHRVGSPLAEEALGEPVVDLEIQPGQMLYLPAGTPHAVTTVSRDSIHISIGTHVPTWSGIIGRALERMRMLPCSITDAVPAELLDLNTDDEALRRQMIAVFEDCLGSVDMSWVRGSSRQHVISMIKPPADGQIRRLLAPRTIASTTVVTRRDFMPATVYERDGLAHIEFPGGGYLSGDSVLGEALDFIATSETDFCADDVPGTLGAEEKVQLIGALIDRGLLRLSDEQA